MADCVTCPICGVQHKVPIWFDMGVRFYCSACQRRFSLEEPEMALPMVVIAGASVYRDGEWIVACGCKLSCKEALELAGAILKAAGSEAKVYVAAIPPKTSPPMVFNKTDVVTAVPRVVNPWPCYTISNVTINGVPVPDPNDPPILDGPNTSFPDEVEYMDIDVMDAVTKSFTEKDDMEKFFFGGKT